MDSKFKNLGYCVLVFQIFGLHPDLFETSQEKQNRKKTLFLKLYSFCFMCFILTLFILQTQFDYVKNATNNETTTINNLLKKIFGNLSFFGTCLSIFSLFISSFIFQEKTNKMFMNFEEISIISNDNFMKKISYKNFVKYFILFIVVSIISMLTSFCYLALDPRLIQRTLLIGLPVIFMTIASVKYDFLVILINFHLNYVHIILKEILEIEQGNIEIQNRFKSKLSQKIYAKQKLDQKIKIRLMWKIYNLIEENCNLLNNSMHVSNFLDFLSTIISIISCFYDIFVVIMRHQDKFAAMQCIEKINHIL